MVAFTDMFGSSARNCTTVLVTSQFLYGYPKRTMPIPHCSVFQVHSLQPVRVDRLATVGFLGQRAWLLATDLASSGTRPIGLPAYDILDSRIDHVRRKAAMKYVAVLILLMTIVPAPAMDKDHDKAPLPTLIARAHAVFLVNGGGSYEAYDALFGALKSWGQYQIVGSISEADIVFTVQAWEDRIPGDSMDSPTREPATL
jgi:hypothetical protein